ncbi:MAG: zinc ribbon domain-containing protein [Candidatus Hydrogenedentota bacterium]|nr:MAG: zinc ribbon domain-containing protein [Candidatus Hydrogenedentota bacterium]
MPTYVYRTKAGGCKLCRDSFEQKQSMKEAPLEKCPSCGSPVERVICVPFVHTGSTDKSVLSDNNLKKHGFTKLVNEGEGKFRRTP